MVPMLLAMLLAFAAQDQVCETNGATTVCKTPVPGPTYVPGQTPRDQANAKISQLIAENRCEDAKRLAKFYGWADLTKSVARACP